jgi:hypothetical protein
MNDRGTSRQKIARQYNSLCLVDAICVLTFFALALFSVGFALAEEIPDSLTKKLDEQRAKAGPELQRAIDEIWRQIVAEGR